MNIVVTAQTPINPEHCFITLGQYCWGKGDTVADALNNCQKCHPLGPTRAGYKKEKYITRVAPRNCEVDRFANAVITWKDHDVKHCPYCTIGKGIQIAIQ